MNEEAIVQLWFIVDGLLTRDEYQHLLNIRQNLKYTVKAVPREPWRLNSAVYKPLGSIDG
jgi:hypothetical protein